MLNIRYLYPNFKKKCLTFSYDDGVIQDLKFLNFIKNTKFKVTFNLNSGLSKQIKYRDGIDNSRLDLTMNKDVYINHEIASHGLYHFHMEKLNYEDNYKQIKEDIVNLKSIFQKDIKGFVYPYGTYNQDTINALKDLNVKYSRTTKATYSFALPKDFLLWNPTLSHSDEKLMSIIEKFKKTDVELALLYIWGHTYEFENQNNWEVLLSIIKELDNQEDIAYLTNIEIYEYLNALKNVIINCNKLINNSSVDLYLKIDGKNRILTANSMLELEGEFTWKKF